MVLKTCVKYFLLDKRLLSAENQFFDGIKTFYLEADIPIFKKD